MIVTDWMAPGRSVLSRMPDPRVRQYWDPDHLVAKRMAADAQAPQPTPECWVRNGILWDLAAVYPPGPRWVGRMPPALVFSGPVVDETDAIETALARRHSRVPTLGTRLRQLSM